MISISNHEIIYNVLSDFASKQPNDYADIDVIIAELQTMPNPKSLLETLPYIINFSYYPQNNQPTTYDGVMKHLISEIFDDLNSFNINLNQIQTVSEIDKSTDFTKTKNVANLLNELAQANNQVDGQVVIDTTYGFNAITYKNLFETILIK